MNHPAKIFFRSFVKPFYRENKGFFVFVFAMMFFIVSTVDGAGLYEYHYSLATGMLESNVFLSVVFFAWFLYVRKCVVFVSNVMLDPHYAFFQIYNRLSKTKRLRLFLIVETWLLMPVLLYALFICFVSLNQHLYLPVLWVIVYLLLLCIAAGVWHVNLLENLHNRTLFAAQKSKGKFRVTQYFQFILLRFVVTKQTTVLAGIKVFTCGTLYLVARNYTAANDDTSMAFLFFNFGILATGVLIYRIREFEESYLSFYSGLPVSLVRRFLQYSLFYFILLIPEIITVGFLLPVHLHYEDGINFVLTAVSLLLLMNSITFVEDFKMKDYMKVLLLIFCVQYILLVTVGFVLLYSVIFIAAFIMFLRSYCKFERSI